jgi:hypothetical protein
VPTFMRNCRCTVVVIVLVLAFLLTGSVPLCLVAQSTNASVSGRVLDQQNAVIPDVEIEIKNVDTGLTQTTKTNKNGIYSFPSLPPGRYLMNVRREQFRTVSVTGITLHVQDDLSRNFVMLVGSSAESITVSAEGVNINTADAAVSTVIDRQFVANMPLNGRSFQDLLTLTPGVALVPSAFGPGQSGEITVNGQRTEANYFTVDGVSANVGASPSNGGLSGGFGGGTPAETALGTTHSVVSLDALQEFRATTSTYSAEYGRTPGGQFSFTTRSGTNELHGTAFDYFRNDALDANNWFDNAERLPKQKERQNDFGGTFGGPVLIPGLYNGADKTFFFFSYEGLRLWTPQVPQSNFVPDQTLRHNAPAPLQPALNAFPLPNAGEDGLNDGLGIYQVGPSFPSSIDSVSVRLDHSFGDAFKVFARYADTPSSSSTYSNANKISTVSNNRLLTLGATNVVGAKQTNELRFNITQANLGARSVLTNQGGAIPFSITTLPGPNGQNLSPDTSTFGFFLAYGGQPPGFILANLQNAQRQYNVADTYAWLLGRHSLKFGVDWRRLGTLITPVLSEEFVVFPSEAAVLANNVGPDGFIGANSSSPTLIGPLYNNVSFFLQDEWKAAERLSLSLGLRWEINPAPGNLTGPSPYTLDQVTNLGTARLAPTGTPLWRTDWRAFAPRVGLAYQLRQTPGRATVLRAGVGLFYDLGSTLGSLGFGGIGFASSATFSNVSFPLNSAQMTLPPPSIAPPYSNVAAFDPNLTLPYTVQWNVAIEQSLGTNQALTMGYVGSAGRQLLKTFFLNPPPENPNFPPGCGCLLLTQNGANSEYHALQIQFQRTLSRGLQALTSYTFAHSIDNATSNFELGDLLERSSSDFDVRHNFQTAVSYDIPGHYSNGLMSALASRWSVDARISAQSGLPVDVIGSGGFDPFTKQSVNFHPNLVPGEPLYLHGSQYPGGRVINYNAFTAPTSGPGATEEGDTPRNYARAPGNWQFNTALRREFPIHRDMRLQFRAEAFNLFNHPNFGNVFGFWGAGPFNPQCLCGFGVARGTLSNSLNGLNSLYQTGGPRSLQIALKLLF